MLLLLVRHGVTPETGVKLAGWRRGVHLSPEGRKQAESLVPRLDGVPIDAIYASPLERAMETSKPLAAARKIRVRVREGLRDVNYGDWQGRPLRTLARTRHFREVVSSPLSARFPGGEALHETYTRTVDEVSRIVADHPKQTVAVFCHADIVKMALAHFAGIHLEMYARIAIAPASVSAVWAGQGGPRLLRVNDTGSLRDLAPERRVSRTARVPSKKKGSR